MRQTSKRTSRKKSKRKQQTSQLADDLKKTPRSLVISIGTVSLGVRKLIHDLRTLMKPYTAMKLKVLKNNTLRDFVSNASSLKVSHFIILSQTQRGVYLRLCRVPHGPTITFRVESYTLSDDLKVSSKKSYGMQSISSNPACLITNLLPDDQDKKHLGLTAQMLQEMFPSINPNEVSFTTLRRCCLVHYDPETSLVDLRHYTVTMSTFMEPTFEDTFIKTDTDSIKSECDSDITCDNLEDKGSSVRKTAKSTIKLKEIGPRLSLMLYKIEEGLHEGVVLYHSIVSKTPEEILECSRKRQEKTQAKELRKKSQEANVQKKLDKIKKKKSRKFKLEEKSKGNESEEETTGVKESEPTDGDGKKKKKEGKSKLVDKIADMQVKLKQFQNAASKDQDDDAQYYKEEVGEDPDPDLFKKRKRSVHFSGLNKKQKRNPEARPKREIGFAIRRKKK